MSMRNTKGYGAKNPTYQFTGTKDEYIALLKRAIQWQLDDMRHSDNWECLLCWSESVQPESVQKKYGGVRDCPDEVYWLAKTWEDENPEDEDGEPIEVPVEEEYEGHKPDCNGVCNYDLINAECIFEGEE
jgi:hypothetical protein